jgi:selenocysteine lyase/cysteine desulfurase
VWREAAADVVVVPADSHGRVDPVALDRLLAQYAHRDLRIGSFSAASNVTGVITDVDAIARVLHSHNALACFDYAAAGPYLPIDMAGKDAVFLSPHKFIGGPQTPGVLVASRRLIRRTRPTLPGGGTVMFVSPWGQRYLDDPAAREEAGTPAIVESIRAGMVFALKQAVGAGWIREREDELCRAALDRWGANGAIELLGDREGPRLPIFSFRVWHRGRLLHHNFVVAVLSDLFGIQARGGCSCAGPYGHRLLAIDPDKSHSVEAEVVDGRLGAKPGWARLSFNYFYSDAVAAYLIEAVDLVARHAHRLLTDYRFDPASGTWRHRDVHHASAGSLTSLMDGHDSQVDRWGDAVLDDHLRQARAIFDSRDDAVSAGPTGLSASFEAVRDFHLPPQCLATYR